MFREMKIAERHIIDDQLAAVITLVSDARAWPPMKGVDAVQLELHLVRLMEAAVFIERIIFKDA